MWMTQYNYIEFDTLGVIQMPEPRYVEERMYLNMALLFRYTKSFLLVI